MGEEEVAEKNAGGSMSGCVFVFVFVFILMYMHQRPIDPHQITVYYRQCISFSMWKAGTYSISQQSLWWATRRRGRRKMLKRMPEAPLLSSSNSVVFVFSREPEAPLGMDMSSSSPGHLTTLAPFAAFILFMWALKWNRTVYLVTGTSMFKSWI